MDNNTQLPKQANKPAFRSASTWQADGLTKREYFAAMAMQGLCSHQDIGNNSAKRIAELAIEQADELLKQLEE